MKIESMAKLIAELQSPYISVHQDRCVLVRNHNAACLRCAEACTSGCIHFDGEQLTVSPEKCIGCGTCATVCPTCALEARHPADEELFGKCLAGMKATGGVACIACGQVLDAARGLVDEERAVRVECLGRVEESLLTRLVQAGATRIALVRGGCEGCEHVTGHVASQSVLATERELLDAWGCDVEVGLSHKLPACVRARDEGYDAAKRALFTRDKADVRFVGEAVAKTAVNDALGAPAAPQGDAPYVVRVTEDGTLPHFIPDRRERLLDALAAIGEPKDVELSSRLWGHVDIDLDLCVSCRMCATFCPTGAIAKFDDADGTMGVEHRAGDCAKCLCCEKICPAHAITVRDGVSAPDVLSGVVWRFEMTPPAVKRGNAHSMWHCMETLMNTDQVYER